jgi:hypothetical protein
MGIENPMLTPEYKIRPRHADVEAGAVPRCDFCCVACFDDEVEVCPTCGLVYCPECWAERNNECECGGPADDR